MRILTKNELPTVDICQPPLTPLPPPSVRQTSSFLDTTPSPNKVLTEHPLSAFIKTEPGEEDEAGTSCAVSSVKQEPEAEGGGGEVDDVKAEAPTMTEDVTPSAVS